MCHLTRKPRCPDGSDPGLRKTPADLKGGGFTTARGPLIHLGLRLLRRFPTALRYRGAQLTRETTGHAGPAARTLQASGIRKGSAGNDRREALKPTVPFFRPRRKSERKCSSKRRPLRQNTIWYQRAVLLPGAEQKAVDAGSCGGGCWVARRPSEASIVTPRAGWRCGWVAPALICT